MDVMVDTRRAGTFSGRVGVLFGTQVFGAGIGIVNGILLARLLGPAAKGDYYLLILVPSTVMVLIQLGLPQAFGYFSARGQTLGMVGKSLVLTVVLSSAAFVGVFALLPLLRDAFLHGIELGQVLFAFLALPLALSATFTTGIVMGRQAVRWYAAVNIAYPIATTFLLVAILGGLGPSVNGAIAVYLAASLIQSIGFTIAARRVNAANTEATPVSYRALFRYGLPFYPGSITGFFSYRIDAYLIVWLIADASAPLGYYSMAVGLAELVFFFPSAVSALFFPHVAGSPREDADRQVAMVSRVTLLVTGAFAILLIPAAVMMIWILLPAFGPSILPFLVLLPGVVALSASRVVGGYVAGIGRPGINSYVSVGSFVVNVIANLILIPRFGIVGASAASLVSYSLSALWITVIAARLTRTPLAGFWIPRVSDARFTVATVMGLVGRLRGGRAGSRDDGGAQSEP
jgi:O-antigen/teichoic acid export membrane protein